MCLCKCVCVWVVSKFFWAICVVFYNSLLLRLTTFFFFFFSFCSTFMNSTFFYFFERNVLKKMFFIFVNPIVLGCPRFLFLSSFSVSCSKANVTVQHCILRAFIILIVVEIFCVSYTQAWNEHTMYDFYNCLKLPFARIFYSAFQFLSLHMGLKSRFVSILTFFCLQFQFTFKKHWLFFVNILIRQFDYS